MRMQEWAERKNYTTAPLCADLAVRFIHETAFDEKRVCVLCLCFPAVCLFISIACTTAFKERPNCRAFGIVV